METYTYIFSSRINACPNPVLKTRVFYKGVIYRENVNWGCGPQGRPELDLLWALEGM